MTNSNLMGNFLKVALRCRAVGVSCLSVALLAASAAAQNPPPKPSPEPEDIVRVYSELVQTDVMVFDKQGKFVNGLKREDFELRIDGKQRPVEFFERIAAGTRDEDTQLSAARGVADAGPRTAANVAAPLDRGRTIFFFVDDLHLSPSNLLQMRKLLTRYVEDNLSQNDIAAVASASGTIGFLQQLTDNKAVLRAAIDRLQARSTAFSDLQRPPMSGYHALMIDRQDPDVTSYFVDALLKENDRLPRDLAEEQVRSRAHQILQYSASTNTNTLAGLESLVRTSGTLPGRKLVIFISDGFFLDDRNSDSRERLRKITSAAAKSGVVIYSMDARGLVASLDDASSPVPFDPTGRLSRGAGGELTASQDAMNSLARDTGGRPIFNTNALDVGLTTAIRETSLYYMLAWRPEPDTTGDKYRKLSVNLIGHSDWTVRVRQGFYDREAPMVRHNRKVEPSVAASADPAVSETVLRDAFREVFQNSSDLPVATNVNFVDMPAKGMMLTIAMMVNAQSLHFVQEGNLLKASVDIRGTVYNDRGNAGATFTDRLTVTATSPEQLAHANKEMIYTYQVFLPAGLYQVRVGARDPATGKIGTSYDWIQIPSLASQKLALSSIMTGERVATQNNAAAESVPGIPDASIRVDRRFHRNSVLRFIVFVYNALKSSTGAQPDVGVQVIILRDQQPVITTPSKKISTEGLNDLDRLPYAGDLSLEGLAPGNYVLQISAVDRIAKSTATQRVRLEIQ